MLVEATNKTSENTFIRDKLHLARNELNGDLNIYERMIEKQERGIGKEIEFEMRIKKMRRKRKIHMNVNQKKIQFKYVSQFCLSKKQFQYFKSNN